MRPIVINNFLRSATILADAGEMLRVHCIEGIELDRARIDAFVDKSLMLVTALSPEIGYHKAAHIAERVPTGATLREAALASGHVTAEQFDSVVDPRSMVGDGVGGA